MMITLLAAAAAAVSVTCDLEAPSGKPGCTHTAVDALSMTAIQVVGTHNSYKMAIAPNEMAMIRAVNPREADGIDYSHPPLARQLGAGARQLEIDIVYDPDPGAFAAPMGFRNAGAKAVPYDFAPLRQPGLKVIHEPSVDYRSVCPLFVGCLQDIRAWSKAHPAHVPILVLLNLKEGGLNVPGATRAPVFDAQAMDRIDAEIRSVFSDADLITPDQVQGRYATLREAVAAGAWPSLKAARGRILVALDCPPDQVARYRGERKVLEGRAAFVNTDIASPAAGYITLNEPGELAGQIASALKAGLIVRTRADADTREARTHNTTRQVQAFASGAQYVSTDYMTPDMRFGPYVAKLPNEGTARLSPARR